MPLVIKQVDPETETWLMDRAQSRGTSPEVEASELLHAAVEDRIRRERLFLAACEARVPSKGPPLTEREVEDAINWGRA
jgi:plasmid stability protein